MHGVRPFAIHGDLYYELHVTREEDAEKVLAIRVPQHAVEGQPAAGDSFRLCLLAVDCQNTFCTPGFELFVPGAPADSRRLCEFVYRNLDAIT